jgi:parvulin-like peptidyl-prolyl isomerase
LEVKGMKVVLLFTCLAILTSGCSSKEERAALDERELAAKVDDWVFTREQVQGVIDQMSEPEKLKFDTPGGRAKVADGAIQEELYYREGMKLGLQKGEEIARKVKAFERSLVVEDYFERHVRTLALPSEEEMHDFYEENQERFTQQPIARAQHILSKSNPEKLLEYKSLVEAKKEKFTKLAQLYSDDQSTRQDGGDLGYFNPGGYMRGIGYADEISNAAFELDVGEISAPIKWKHGWSIVVLNEIRPAQLKPFEEVRDKVAEILVVPRLDKVKEATYTELRGKYTVDNYLANEFKLISKTPEELWNLAQNSLDSFERLAHYEEIVERFPDSPHAAKAMFMIGFVNAEELKNLPAADRAFNRVINEYPDSDVAQSAKYMLETMYKTDRDLQKPEDVHDH